MRSVLREDRKYSHHHTQMMHVMGTGVAVEPLKRRRHNGSLASRYLKIACKRCNETWMSSLQQRAKPLLTAFIDGRWPRLGVEGAESLVRWMTMFTMVIEAAHEPTLAIPQRERDAFRQTRDPLPNWSIWIGLHDQIPHRNFYHRGFELINDHAPAISLPGARRGPMLTSRKPNTQITFAITGPLVMLASSSTVTRSLPVDLLSDLALKRVWPARDRRLSRAPSERVAIGRLDLLMNLITDRVMWESVPRPLPERLIIRR